MKRIFAGVLAMAVCCTTAFAHPPIHVFVDGGEVSFDQPPIIKEDRTLVPMRRIFEALGAGVRWEESTKTVTAMNTEDVIVFRIGEKELYKNGKPVYTMSVPAQIVNDRTLVPLRAVAESMGANVAWDGKAYTIHITSPQKEEQPIPANQTVQNVPKDGGFLTEIKAPDGTVVLTAKLECDILKGSDAGVSAINTALANETFAKGLGFVREYANRALQEYAKNPKGFLPYYIVGNYRLMRGENGYASFLASVLEYNGTGSGKRTDFSHTYALSTGKEVQVTELLPDSQKDLEALWEASFTAMIDAAPDSFYRNATERLKRSLSDVEFYLTKEGIVFYLPPETIAPAEAGVVSFEVAYEVK